MVLASARLVNEEIGELQGYIETITVFPKYHHGSTGGEIFKGDTAAKVFRRQGLARGP
jgi:hypothetical protein